MNPSHSNTVLAMQNVDVLRTIEALGDGATIDAIVDATGRDRSNLRKTLAKLEAVGLILYADDVVRPHGGLVATLTPAAAPMLKAAAVADGREIGVPGFVGLYHAQITRSTLNPRHDFDSDDALESLDELRQDILQNGLLQSLLVRPLRDAEKLRSYIQVTDANDDPLPLYEIIAGERRWRAIGAALSDGDWPEDRLIPAQVIATDDRGHTLRALAENLQRRALNPLEEAHAFSAEVEAGMSTAELAERLSVTQRYIQMRLQLLALPEDDQVRLVLPKDHPDHLTVTKAREIVQHPKAAAPPPGAPEMSAMELLILAEVMHKVTAAPAQGYQTTECAPDARETISSEFPTSWLSFNACAHHDGRSYVSIGYNGREALLRNAPDFADMFALNRLRHAALGDEAYAAHEPGRYVTPWLNGPWELSDAGRKLLADREAEALAAAKAEADEAAAVEAEEARGAVFLNRALAIEAALRDQRVFETYDVVVACAHGGAPLPWAIDDAGEIVDATGAPVRAGHGAPLEARRRLMVAGINALAGVATPEAAPEAPPTSADLAEADLGEDRGDLDRPAFEAAIAAELVELKIDAKAGDVLDTALREIGCDFGHPDYGWTAADAKILVHEAYLGE